MSDSRLELACRQIEFARQYTLSLLADIDEADWFWRPPQGVTHVAWQVGHLAMAQYGLCLFRMRGRQPADGQLMSSAFRKKFSKGSTPDADPAAQPSPSEIRDVLDRVHRQTMDELPGYGDAVLNEPIEEPYAIYPVRLGGLFFCAMHEMMHAGQLGLLRRLMGKATTR
ncbi:MAG: DinB family protein [Pirellulaceae bacterium]